MPSPPSRKGSNPLPSGSERRAVLGLCPACAAVAVAGGGVGPTDRAGNQQAARASRGAGFSTLTPGRRGCRIKDVGEGTYRAVRAVATDAAITILEDRSMRLRAPGPPKADSGNTSAPGPGRAARTRRDGGRRRRHNGVGPPVGVRRDRGDGWFHNAVDDNPGFQPDRGRRVRFPPPPFGGDRARPSQLPCQVELARFCSLSRKSFGNDGNRLTGVAK